VEEFSNLSRITSLAAGIASRNQRFSVMSQQARLRAIRIKSGHLIEGYFYELCKNLKINSLIECGAHDAATSIKFCNFDENNKAIAFEANPYVFGRFNSQINNRNIQYLNLGVGKAVGKLKLNIPVHSPGSWTPQASFDVNIEIDMAEDVEIEVTTLDVMCAELEAGNESQSATAIWIDVEGFAWEVLNGAKQTLSSTQCKLLYIEVSDEKIWGNEKSALSICEFLKGFDYYPIARDCPLANLYNIVFIKKTEIESISQMTNEFWYNLARIKPGFYERKSMRFYLSKIKSCFVRLTPGIFQIRMEKIFAKLGSKSSKEKLKF
jgi:FkbM family methyltransferase